MSVNIKTANGLKKLSGDTLTKHSIAATLGYTPADPDSVNANLTSHTTNDDIHVTLAEKDKFTDYKQLRNTPNIIDDGSGEFTISDPSGNTALQVSSDGVTKIASLTVAGRDLSTFMDQTDFDTFDPDRHITPAEREQWNDTSKMNGNIQIEDDGAEFAIVDSNGNAAVMIDSIGTIQLKDAEDNFQITDSEGNVAVQLSNSGILNVAELEIKGENILSTIEQAEDEFAAALSVHEEKVIHITADERTKWNDTSKMEGNLQLNDEGKEFIISDNSGNVALQVTENGTTQVAALEINGVNTTNEIARVEGNASANLNAHTSRTDNPHTVTATQVGLGNVDNTSDADKPISNAQAAVNDVLQQGIDANAAAINSIKNGTDDAVAKNAEHASYADVWTTPRTITLDGDASGSVEVDGSKDVTLTVAVKNDSHTHLINPTAQTNSEGPLTFTSDSGNCAVTYTVNHKTSTVTAGTYTRVTVDEYGHITSGETPDASWSSIVGRPDIIPATDGNDTEIIVMDSSDNVALQLDSTGVLNLAGATVNGIEVAVDYIDYTNDIAFDVTELVVS